MLPSMPNNYPYLALPTSNKLQENYTKETCALIVCLIGNVSYLLWSIYFTVQGIYEIEEEPVVGVLNYLGVVVDIFCVVNAALMFISAVSTATFYYNLRTYLIIASSATFALYVYGVYNVVLEIVDARNAETYNIEVLNLIIDLGSVLMLLLSFIPYFFLYVGSNDWWCPVLPNPFPKPQPPTLVLAATASPYSHI